MIELKLLLMAVCAVLFWWGGYSFLAARRYIMPFVLGVGLSLFSHVWWLGMAILPVCGALCLGYGINSPLRHIFGNGWGRGVWGLLAAICLSLPLFLTHHLGIDYGSVHAGWLLGSCICDIVYLSLNFILENALKDIPQIIGDPLIGFGMSSILLLVRP